MRRTRVLLRFLAEAPPGPACLSEVPASPPGESAGPGQASATGTPGDLGLADPCGRGWVGEGGLLAGKGRPAGLPPRPCPAPATLHLPAAARQHRAGAACRGLPPPHPHPFPLSHRMASGCPPRSHAPGAAEDERAGVAAQDPQRSERPGQRERHSWDSGSASPVLQAEEEKSPSSPATSGYREDPRAAPPASGPRAGQGEAAGLAGGSGAAGLGPSPPCCQHPPGGDGASAPGPGLAALRAGQRAQGWREALLCPLPPARAYSSPRSRSSPGGAASASGCRLKDKEKEAHAFFLAFLDGTNRVPADVVSKALPAAPSWGLPCLLPARGLLGGCWLCRAAPLPAPCAVAAAPPAPAPAGRASGPHPPSLSLFSLAVRKRPRS